jgi:protein TonB
MKDVKEADRRREETKDTPIEDKSDAEIIEVPRPKRSRRKPDPNERGGQEGRGQLHRRSARGARRRYPTTFAAPRKLCRLAAATRRPPFDDPLRPDHAAHAYSAARARERRDSRGAVVFYIDELDNLTHQAVTSRAARPISTPPPCGAVRRARRSKRPPLSAAPDDLQLAATK